MSLLYTPPEGYYDTPFIFVYSTSSLNNGQDAPNQFINMDPGVGDFICRRVAGIQNVVDPTDGKFQMRDNSLRYIQSLPIFAQGTDEIPIPEGILYKNTGAIRFDLFDVQVP